MPQQVVTQNQPQNPYKEFTYSIPAGGRQRVYYATNYFRVLSLSAATLSANFYGTSDTTIIGAGMGIKLPDVLPWVDLVNTGGGTITVTIALGIGEFNDNRLTVSGNINTVPIGGSTIASAQVTVATVGATNVSAAAAGKQRVTIKNLQGNAEEKYIGAAGVTTATGFRLDIGESFTIDTAADIFAISPTLETEKVHVLTESA